MANAKIPLIKAKRPNNGGYTVLSLYYSMYLAKIDRDNLYNILLKAFFLVCYNNVGNILGRQELMDKWDKRFMELAHVIAGWSSCYQPNRKIGAVIVKNKRIITTGYNGAPSGFPSCAERKECLRRQINIPSGTKQEFCYAIHAEQNAIVQAAKLGISIDGATLYCTHQPCVICAKLIINSGIERVVYKEPYPDQLAIEIFKEVGIKLERFDE
ncbi:MAG: hypothetical protein ACFWUE_09385 [Xylanivirga thermophila]|jgi:dCMP deaminase